MLTANLQHWAVVAAIILVPALHGEDFRLTHVNSTPISLHTALSYEGKGAYLTATAKNISGSAIRHATICVLATNWPRECLFTLNYSGVWEPGTEQRWEVSSNVHVKPDLSHSASIVEFEGGGVSAATVPVATPNILPVRTTVACVQRPGCEPRLRNDAPEKKLTAKDLKIVVRISTEQDPRYYAAWITVQNFGADSIDVLPSEIVMQTASGALHELPINKVLVKPSIARILIESAIGGLEGWQAANRTSSSTITASDGTGVQVDNYKNGGGPTAGQMQADAQRAAQNRIADLKRDGKNDWISGTHLRGNTVDQFQALEGAMYFPREGKGPQNIVVKIPIGNTVFEFPFNDVK